MVWKKPKPMPQITIRQAIRDTAPCASEPRQARTSSQFETLGPERFQQLCQAVLVSGHPNVRCLPVGQRMADVMRFYGSSQEPIERLCRADQRPQIDAPRCRYLVVKDVGHAGAEDALRLAFGSRAFVPAERSAPAGGTRLLAVGAWVPEIAPNSVAPPAAPGKCGRIAAVARGRDTQTSDPRIECRVAPGNLCDLTHPKNAAPVSDGLFVEPDVLPPGAVKDTVRADHLVLDAGPVAVPAIGVEDDRPDVFFG
jgi:hypothetical protein